MVLKAFKTPLVAKQLTRNLRLAHLLFCKVGQMMMKDRKADRHRDRQTDQQTKTKMQADKQSDR